MVVSVLTMLVFYLGVAMVVSGDPALELRVLVGAMLMTFSLAFALALQLKREDE